MHGDETSNAVWRFIVSKEPARNKRSGAVSDRTEGKIPRIRSELKQINGSVISNPLTVLRINSVRYLVTRCIAVCSHCLFGGFAQRIRKAEVNKAQEKIVNERL